MQKSKLVLKWVVLFLMAFVFLSGGYAKLSGDPEIITTFQKYGYPYWFQILIGTGEILGALGLFVSRFSRYAAILLTIILIGAIGTHFLYAEFLNVIVPAVLLLILFGTILRNPARETKQEHASHSR